METFDASKPVVY